jgi:aspartate/glutamate racemase
VELAGSVQGCCFGRHKRKICRRDGVEAIVLAGTDLNLVFNEANAGFPAVDCLAAHIDAIVAEMMPRG